MLRKFVSYHGLVVLKNCLAAHIESKTICRHHILTVLKMLPIGTKNSVLKLEEMVNKMTDADIYGSEISLLAQELINSWSTLQLVYKIPKRSHSVLLKDSSVSSPPKKQSQFSITSSSKRTKVSTEEIRRNHSNKEKPPRSQGTPQTPVDSYWKKQFVPAPIINLPHGWVQSYEDGRTVFRNDQTGEMSYEIPTVTLPPPPSVPVGQVDVTPGISSDQLKNIIFAAEEAARIKQLEQEKLEKERLEKEKNRREKNKIRREAEKAKEKERKNKEREQREKKRSEDIEKKAKKAREREEREKRKEVDQEKEEKKMIDKIIHDKSLDGCSTDHLEIQVSEGWSASQIKSLKNQVYSYININ